MENFRFEEGLLREGYEFLGSYDGTGEYALRENGVMVDGYQIDFSSLDYYFNIKEQMHENRYLLVFYDKRWNLYKVMLVSEKLMNKYPFLAKLLGKNKISALEVQGILSILNTKLRQKKWENNTIDRTEMINIPKLALNKAKK